MKKHKDADSYIKSYPKEVQTILRSVRQSIKKSAPKAEEKISYGMVGYKLDGKPLVYFGGFKKHISLFPAGGSARNTFKKELAQYKGGKGTIQFPIDKPLPLGLITKVVKLRVKENIQKTKQPKVR
ncbi:MAG TPA: DUF1801 domain-containing protein [Candidatus Paceibacterota bacterium]|nr:DUF1801 domain-containing protein [Candidatus Paceibacterota bacterium]